MMLGVKFGWISLIVLENMMFSKKVSVFLLFCYYLPLRMFVQTWIFLSVYTSWHLSWNCLCLVICYYLHLQYGVVFRYQRLSFFHAEFFCIFHVYAIWNVLPTRVIMSPTHPQFEKCNLYSIPYISWMNYSRVAFGDEAKFSVSVFVQNH